MPIDIRLSPSRALVLVLALSAPFVAAACAAPTEGDENADETSSAVTGTAKVAVAAVTASSHDGNVPGNVLDGKLDTRWSAEGDGQWIRFDLGASKSVQRVRIAFHKGKERKMRFDIQVSGDGASWSTVRKDASSSGSSLSLETFDFAAKSARYVRIVGYGNTQNDWNSLTEVEVHTAVVTTTPDAGTTVDSGAGGGATTDAGSGGGGGGGGGTVAYPSDLLDLSIWKITLPVARPGGGGPLEVLDLDDYTMDPWFVLTPAKNGVRFRANAGGYTTSNSSYPRSELREMTKTGGRADWSTTSGRHLMRVREAITATPTVKPHVVAAQIHDAEDDVVMVRLEGKRLFVEGGGEELGLLEPNYTLGTPFDVELDASGGRIKVRYNGAQKLDVARATSGCYFKVGAYTQSNTSKGDAASAYGEVVVYSLAVTHQ